MNILEKIVADKRKEIELIKTQNLIADLEKSQFFERKTISFSRNIIKKSGVISEFKRQSPSKGIINNSAKIEDVTIAYENVGVSALSILTNKKYFGGNCKDIINVRNNINIPILRKEFIIDEYQIIEAKSIGADAILLIASVLTKNEILNFTKLAKSLNMEILLEIHNEQELSLINQYVDCVGVNNRNLKTFEVDIQNSINLSGKIPNDFVKISESGISSVSAIKTLKEYGFQGFLIGENFMKTENPGLACKEFINELIS
jgi:indole-3-glycerol phosphate synthase